MFISIELPSIGAFLECEDTVLEIEDWRVRTCVLPSDKK